MAGLVQITAPVEEPITVQEAKLHCRVEHEEDDFIIAGLITGARQWIENFTHRALITQTWELTADEFPTNNAPILLPNGRISSVTSFGYVDPENGVATMDGSPTQYYVDSSSIPGRVYLPSGGSWPTVSGQNSLTIRYTVGYGLAAAVPKAIKAAMLMLVGHWYENREAVSIVQMYSVPFAIESILLPYRIYTIP